MPNIFKAFSRAKAEPYQFPDAAELVVEPEPEEAPPAPEDSPPEEVGGLDVKVADPEPEVSAEPEPEPEENPISFAQLQAEVILANARREAEELMAKSREDARREAEEVFAKAREEGRQEGYVQGMAEASQESRQLREEQARRMEEEVHRFMEQAGVALDRQMDQNVADLRDLALAVAEKVVCVSLKSSGDVISRMIQTAIDKRKKKEWVHTYPSAMPSGSPRSLLLCPPRSAPCRTGCGSSPCPTTSRAPASSKCPTRSWTPARPPSSTTCGPSSWTPQTARRG